LAILTGLVIATIIITAVYVGYHAYEASLHEEVKTHSISQEMETFQSEIVQIFVNGRIDHTEEIL